MLYKVKMIQNVNKIADKTNDRAVVTHMDVAGKIVQFQVDPGASVNILSREMLLCIPLQPCNTTFRMWNDTTHNPTGNCRTVITNCKNRNKYPVEFVILQQMFTPILGKRAYEQTGLVQVYYDNISAVSKDKMNFDHVFANELGMLSGCVHLTFEESTVPTAVASSHVPISMKKKIAQKLSDLEQQKIIAKVDIPTDLFSRMAITMTKSGDILVCIDPHVLNTALKREVHPLPVMDDILPELS